MTEGLRVPTAEARGGTPRSRALTVAGAALLVGSVVVFAASLLARSGTAYRLLWDGWVGNAPLILAALACFGRAIVGGPRRVAAAWLGIGMLSFTVANVIYLAWTQFQSDPPVPSASDLAYLVIYPCVAIALVRLIRGGGQPLTRSLWLDGALGAAGGATALAAVLSPVLSGVHGDLGEALVGAAYPLADLLLVAMICGLLAVRGLRGGSMWLWLAGGLAIFCAADVIYALRVASDSYQVGSVLDALWAIALALMALAIWRPDRPGAIKSGGQTAILAIPLLATLTAVVVLVISSFNRLSVVAVAFATFTLVLAAVRTLVGFRQVQGLSDARRQALTDDLTGLGNRRSLFEHGGKRRNDADEGGRVALLLIDLDNFKEINDTMGHHAGDELLREVGRRLAARLTPADLLVRLGGDEFALVISLAPSAHAREIAARILDRVNQPLVLEGLHVRIDASAGLAECANEGITVTELLRRADVAMYAAKAAGSRIERYEPRLDEAKRARLETVRDLEAAIGRGEFVLHYQPKINVETGVASGTEALVRWQHPTRGLMYPDAFLAEVESSGLMGALTQRVLYAAVRQLAEWRSAGLDITVAVNLSASDLLDEDLTEGIAGLLAAHAVPPCALELEITESVLMTDPERAREVLEGLQGLGLRIAIDDYGTGYCALAYLRDLPIDELKIDRSFLASGAADHRSAAIVRSTIELAHVLDLKVVAEGVENEAALQALSALGCDYAQGYLFSRPVPAEELAAWLAARATEPAEMRHAAPVSPH